MRLTEQDLTTVGRLRREVAVWPRVRWALLVLGLALTPMGLVRDGTVPSVVGVGVLLYTILNWRGSPVSRLLLRLIDSATDTERSEAPTRRSPSA